MHVRDRENSVLEMQKSVSPLPPQQLLPGSSRTYCPLAVFPSKFIDLLLEEILLMGQNVAQKHGICVFLKLFLWISTNFLVAQPFFFLLGHAKLGNYASLPKLWLLLCRAFEKIHALGMHAINL